MTKLLHFEDLNVKDCWKSPSRVVSRDDVHGFAELTGDFNPLHVDAEFAKETPFGERIAHGPMSIGMAFGLLSRLDLFDGSVQALRNVEWSFEAPVRIGDTVRLVAEVEAVSPHPKQGDRGRLTMTAHYLNQRDDRVSRGRFTVVIRRESS